MRHDIIPISLPAAALAAAGALLPAGFARSEVTYRVVAVTGETAPGTNSTLIDFFGPRINNHGQVAFIAELINGDRALYRSILDDPASLELIVRTGDAVPGGPMNATFLHGTGAHLNDDGDLGFHMTVNGLGETHDDGIFRFRDGVLETVAYSGQQVPGLTGIRYDTIWFPKMNSSGSLAFLAGLQGTAVDASNDGAIFAHGFGGLNLILREGNVAPGRPQDTLGTFGLPQIADNGRLAFWTALNDAPDQGSVWMGWPGLFDAVRVAGEGNPNIGGFLGFAMNAEGINILTYDPSGYERDLGGGLAPSIAVGDAGPIGTYARFHEFHTMTNASGEQFTATRFTGPVADADTALVHVATSGQDTVVVREGDAAPGYWNNVVFDDMFEEFTPVDLDDSGRLYYLVPLRGAAITTHNDRALYARGLDGSTEILFRKGQLLDVGEGDWRIVAEFAISNSRGTQSGARGSTNDIGDVALAVTFNDGSEAIVVLQLGPFCPGDFNHDARVNVLDLLTLIQNWGQTTAIGADGDTDRNGFVDINDLVELLLAWGLCF